MSFQVDGNKKEEDGNRKNGNEKVLPRAYHLYTTLVFSAFTAWYSCLVRNTVLVRSFTNFPYFGYLIHVESQSERCISNWTYANISNCCS